MSRISYNEFVHDYPAVEAAGVVAGGCVVYSLLRRRWSRPKSTAGAAATTCVAATALALGVQPPVVERSEWNRRLFDAPDPESRHGIVAQMKQAGVELSEAEHILVGDDWLPGTIAAIDETTPQAETELHRLAALVRDLKNLSVDKRNSLQEQIALRFVALAKKKNETVLTKVSMQKAETALTRMLRDNDRACSWVAADGACLFHSCAEQVEGWKAPQLRAAVVESHRKNSNLRGFLVEQTLEEYCKAVAQETYWGGEPEIQALPEILQCNIVVYAASCLTSSNLSATAVRKEYPIENGVRYEKTIEILLKGHHYWIVKRTNGK